MHHAAFCASFAVEAPVIGETAHLCCVWARSVHGGGSRLRGASGSLGSDLNFLRGMSPPARDEEPEVMQVMGPKPDGKQGM